MEPKCILCSQVRIYPEVCLAPCFHGGVCRKCATIIVNAPNDEVILGCPVCKQIVVSLRAPPDPTVIVMPPQGWKDDEYKSRWRLAATNKAIPIQKF
jgi:hypothetical protein